MVVAERRENEVGREQAALGSALGARADRACLSKPYRLVDPECYTRLNLGSAAPMDAQRAVSHCHVGEVYVPVVSNHRDAIDKSIHDLLPAVRAVRKARRKCNPAEGPHEQSGIAPNELLLPNHCLNPIHPGVLPKHAWG